MTNANIELYKKQIIEITNNSGLAIGSAYYVLKDVLNELKIAYQNAINNELSESDTDINKVTKIVDLKNNIIEEKPVKEE